MIRQRLRATSLNTKHNSVVIIVGALIGMFTPFLALVHVITSTYSFTM